eukprot:TRINITY_DN50942_c0_g1_i1.p1 TRINITY_DN50942_c0_g1~~TRINITY_DN50942_c0_g1_i1.p1  ORF type:complete len:788 (+),score=191.28 TRINITY_DN50942_c0_g1_i1:84-2447(+)
MVSIPLPVFLGVFAAALAIVVVPLWRDGKLIAALVFGLDEAEFSGFLLEPEVAPAAEDYPSQSRGRLHQEAVQAIRAGAYNAALELLKRCIQTPDSLATNGDAERAATAASEGSLADVFVGDKAACLGLQAELHLIGGGVDRNLSTALRLYQEGADLGDPDSQYALGVLHSNLLDEVVGSAGSGGASSNSEAAHVFRRGGAAQAVLQLYAAAMSGHPGALMAMGYRYARGYGVEKSCDTAALYYIEVARKVANVYSAGMPQAVELVRLGVEGQDRTSLSRSEVSLFVELAGAGDANVALAVGKRYLLGIEGFTQNYTKAAQHLHAAARQQVASATSLLGYMYTMGLGVQKSLDVAYSFFVTASMQDDALGHNGLGYFHFHGITVGADKPGPPNLELAVKHFNASARGGNGDGMFNLATLYMTGMGVEQSHRQAMIWYTKALDRGHTPAAYALAILHLNSIGTAKSCKIAVDLLKRVCERGSWVAHKLQQAYQQKDSSPESTAWLFLRLADSGHEVAQMNFAQLLDSGNTRLLADASRKTSTWPAGGSVSGALEPLAEKHVARMYAQRHYEMSAEQGNVVSDLKLGDYAYYGWGVRINDGSEAEEEFAKFDDDAAVEAELQRLLEGGPPEVTFVQQEASPQLALSHYKRISATRVVANWMQPFVARASFNIGLMHHFGVGTTRSAGLAQQYYTHCLDVDPDGVWLPIWLMLLLLSVEELIAMPITLDGWGDALLGDLRTHVLVLQFFTLFILFLLRRQAMRGGRQGVPPPPQEPRQDTSDARTAERTD